MGGKRKQPVGPRAKAARDTTPPIPAEPVDLLAGLAPGVELHADDVPPGLWPEGPGTALPAQMSVAEAGKMLRSGDTTIRRLIRTPELQAARAGKLPSDRRAAGHVDRAGAPPPTRRRPGE